jgi:hypothetical protein
MTPCKRVVWELERWAQRSVHRLVHLMVLLAMLGAGAAVAAETITLHIPSTTVTYPTA